MKEFDLISTSEVVGIPQELLGDIPASAMGLANVTVEPVGRGKFLLSLKGIPFDFLSKVDYARDYLAKHENVNYKYMIHGHTCVVIVSYGVKEKVGVSIHHPSDRWSKEIGIALALMRALGESEAVQSLLTF